MSILKGKILKIFKAVEVSATFKKRELILETDEQYPQKLKIEFTQNKTELLNSYKEGDEVEVAINIQGREWISPQNETKYFVSLKGWKIDLLEVSPAPFPEPENDGKNDPTENTYADDLPF